MKLWKFLTTDVSALGLKRAEDFTKAGTDTTKTVLDLAKSFNEQSGKAEFLKEYAWQFSSLLDALNSPIAQLVKDTVPFAPLALGVLRLIAETTKQDPTIEQCVFLVTQTAYLESVQTILAPYLSQMPKAQAKASEAMKRQLEALGDRDFSYQDAKDALLHFPTSKLAREFEAVLKLRLREAGFPVAVGDRITWHTSLLIHKALAEHADALKPLAELHRNGGREVWERYQSIQNYLEHKIRPLPNEVIFREESTDPHDLQITYQELYVPLKAQPLDCDGKKIEDTPPVELIVWISQILQDPARSHHLMFIQGEAGRGKSVFCRMFADLIRRTQYPSYIPILIRLRDLRTLTNRLQDTLASSLELQNCDFVTSDSGWLTDASVRFFFLLDGFDELLMEDRKTGGLKEFLEQVEQFQQNSHHRFLITGRPLALLQVEKLISQTRNIQRIELLPMDDGLMQTWLKKWAGKAGVEETQKFQQFLQACPEDIQTLVREPLLMYLLARMHRDPQESQLSIQMFSEAEGTHAKIQIYDAAIDWVLKKQRQQANDRLTKLEPQERRQFLTDAATCVVHSGNEVARVAMLEARLKDSHHPAARLLEKSRQGTELSADKALNNLLASFYLKPASGEQGGCIEFVHKSFGEFLFAERLLEALQDWTKPGEGRQGPYLVSNEKMHQDLYDLLGYGGLTRDIVSYLTPRLVKTLPADALRVLFERLQDFYTRWCAGEFMDAEPSTLPQRSMRLLNAMAFQRVGQRQVDVHAGLNALICLMELYRHAQTQESLQDITFYPSGRLPESADSYLRTYQLLKVIHYGDSLKLGTFTRIVGPFLGRVNLSRAGLSRADLFSADFNSANLSSADLSRANLISADLFSADLSRADLISADLISADLSSANLISADLFSADLSSANLSSADFFSADLSCANLSRADLSRANLISADLFSADLSSANLSRANLSCANLSCADLSCAYLFSADLSCANFANVTWDNNTQWANARGLHQVVNVPDNLAHEPRFEAAVILSQGIDLVKQGQVHQALEAYQQAQTIDSELEISFSSWNTLCWFGCLHGQATTELLFAGEQAVTLAPDDEKPFSQDTRGLARALLGDLADAVEDFQAAINNDVFDENEEAKQRRLRWIELLKAGTNPFTAEELAALREAEGQ